MEPCEGDDTWAAIPDRGEPSSCVVFMPPHTRFSPLPQGSAKSPV
jgi:hypothetical protein